MASDQTTAEHEMGLAIEFLRQAENALGLAATRIMTPNLAGSIYGMQTAARGIREGVKGICSER